ncbi:V-type ATP synthase subunit E [Candidatus Micrarchaeota archaeon]|nr:V-type ATP synthase subunit E [Candidatus Micrarchaeota archaeon]
MEIEKLKGSLLSEAKAEAEKIIEAAQANAKVMLNEERAKLSALKSEAEENVEKNLEEQRKERIAWARLEAKRVLAEAREDAIKGVIEQFFTELNAVKKTNEYKNFLKRAVPQAVKEFGKGTRVHVLKSDKAALPKMNGTKIVTDLTGLGGASVESADGKIKIDLTLETLFESRRDEIRKQISDKLFGDK